MKFSLVCLALFQGWMAMAGKPCAQLPPGLERMSRGVDITSLDLFPTDLSLASGFRQSLFDFTCDSGATWSHPSQSGFSFAVPDQVAAVNTLPGGALNDKLTVHKQLNSYKKALSVQVGLDVNTVVYGDYSLSVGYKNAQEQILESNATIYDVSACGGFFKLKKYNQTLSFIKVSAYVSAVQMDFKPFVTLKPNNAFVHFLAKLPATYSANPAVYQEFLDTFGTHYFESGIFGGYLRQETIVEDRYRYETNDRDITTNVQAKYQVMVSAKVGVDTSKNTKSVTFDRSTRTSRYYYGGKTNLVNEMSAEQFAKWQETVSHDPWLFGGLIKPIENLIDNEAVKGQIKTAVHVKLTKAYLQELKQTLVLISRQVPQTSAQSGKINELLGQPIPNQAEVLKVAEQVKTLVAQAQAVKDRAFLEQYAAQLTTLQHYELFCKKEVANRCDHELKHDVNEVVAEASHLAVTMSNMAKASSGQPDSETVRGLVSRAHEIVSREQTTQIPQCREKLFCNLCKDVVIDLIKKEPCNTPHIKHLLRVQL